MPLWLASIELFTQVCIKNPESFVHSGFSWEVARQLPLNTAKNPNRKTHLRGRIFLNSAGFSGFFANVNTCSNLAGYYSGFWNRKTHLRSRIFWNSVGFSGFFANVNTCSNLAGYYSGFWSRGTWPSAESPDRDVMRTTRVRSKVERSRACAPLRNTQVWDSSFFVHALFVPKTLNVMGFSGSVNGTTKNPGVLDFGFCQCKWAYCPSKNHCLTLDILVASLSPTCAVYRVALTLKMVEFKDWIKATR